MTDSRPTFCEYLDTDRQLAEYEAMFALRLGVRVGVTLVEPFATSTIMEVERRQKPIRLIDRRG